jgi:hypothetical protein
MTRKKTFLLALAFVALAGIINCTVIEPAFAYQEDEAACQTENEAHCCFICSPAQHQWISSTSALAPHQMIRADRFSFPQTDYPIDPPLRSIFHPPSIL